MTAEDVNTQRRKDVRVSNASIVKRDAIMGVMTG